MATTTQPKTTARKQAPKTTAAPQVSTPQAPSSLSTQSAEVNGINLPQWDANPLMPNDLYSDSSSLPGIGAAEADAAVESIERKRNTVRVIKANIALGTDLIQAATAYRKMEGAAIDYAIAGVNNQTKAVKLSIASVQLDTVNQALLGEQQVLQQSTIRTEGLTALTPITQDEWNTKVEIAQMKVQALKLAGQQMSNTLQQSMSNLLGPESH